MRSEFQYKEQYELIESLGWEILKSLESAMNEKGFATILFSGGSTPKPLFKYLSREPFEWENVRVGLVDERFVPPTHENSNELLIATNFLQDEAECADFCGMWIDGVSYEEAAPRVAQRMLEHFESFDVIVLGMGEDTHTASLFPNNERLKEAYETQEMIIAITPQDAPHKRLSLTKSAILSAKKIFVHFEGEKKIDAYQEAMASGDVYAHPICAILSNQDADIEVHYR